MSAIKCRHYRTSKSECGVCYPCITTRLRAENAALKSALRDVIDAAKDIPSRDHHGVPQTEALDAACDAARALLKETP